MPFSLSTLQRTRLFFVSFSMLIIVAVGLAVLTVLPPSQEWIRELILSNSRIVLAKVDADLTGKGTQVSIIKVQSADTLALEVFQNAGERWQFVKRIILPEKKDAYFNFRGKTSNLVIADVDGDGILEIIAPAFDENLIPRLNVYKFDPENSNFFRMGPDALRF